jgi:hypothetical protein
MSFRILRTVFIFVTLLAVTTSVYYSSNLQSNNQIVADGNKHNPGGG